MSKAISPLSYHERSPIGSHGNQLSVDDFAWSTKNLSAELVSSPVWSVSGNKASIAVGNLSHLRSRTQLQAAMSVQSFDLSDAGLKNAALTMPFSNCVKRVCLK